MGLVNYASDSDADSDSESVAGPAPPPSPPAASAPKPAPKPSARPPPKKSTVTKLIDASNPGRIIVNLPTLSDGEKKPPPASDEPPAKRARLGGGGGSFSGFNALLPPPKNAKAKSSGMGAGSRLKPGVNLKTSAEPGFSRTASYDEGGDAQEYGGKEADGGGDGFEFKSGSGSGLVLPPPKASSGQAPSAPAQPSIPEGQKKAEDVVLVGKPLAFKPLSVSRKPVKKKPISKPASTPSTTSATTTKIPTAAPAAPASTPANPEPKPPAPRISLFSMHTEPEPEPESTSKDTPYEPLFASTYNPPPAAHDAYDSTYASTYDATPAPESLDSFADTLNLSAAARRELFGRQKAPSATSDVRIVNMGAEYDRNEAMRASGELQPVAQPVRAIQSGKHSMRQMVNMVQNQQDALEDSFARGRNNKREAGSKYGW